MTGRFVIPAAVLLLSLLAPGCTSTIRPAKQAPAFYQLEYPEQSVPCPQSFDGGVLVWDFTTSTPYDRTQFTLMGGNSTVSFSEANHWVELPGIMVSQNLKRDLRQGNLFSMVMTHEVTVDAAYEMNGRVLAFGGRETETGAVAELAIEVSLSSTDQQRMVFHEVYDLPGRAFSLNDPASFVRAMNRLAAGFSRRLRDDLCRLSVQTARGDPGSEAFRR